MCECMNIVDTCNIVVFDGLVVKVTIYFLLCVTSSPRPAKRRGTASHAKARVKSAITNREIRLQPHP